MPVVTIKEKSRKKQAASANGLSEQVKEATKDLLDAVDRVLVVYGKSCAQIYYDK